MSSLENFRQTYLRLARFPNSKVKYGARDHFIIWEGIVRPFYFTGKYKLCLNYEKGWPPRVWIVEPDFSQKKSLPHVYAHNRLCLYHPKDWEWESSCNIVNTIIAWSQMWIVYYEDYLINGTWMGPEAQHDRKELDSLSERKGTSKGKKLRKKGQPKFLKDFPIRLGAKNLCRSKRKR